METISNQHSTVKHARLHQILAVFIFLLFFLPFLMTTSHPLQPDFYQENMSVMIALIGAVIGFCIAKELLVSKVVLFGVLIVVFIVIHSVIVTPIYFGNSVLVAGVITTATLLVFALRSMDDFKPKLFDALCYGLVSGAVIQCGICFHQTAQLVGLFSEAQPGKQVFGTFGQRNLLAEYLFWALIALAYLSANNKLPKVLWLSIATCIVTILGLAGSRATLLYVLVVGAFSMIVMYRQPNLRVLAKQILFPLFFILLIQFIAPLILTNVESGAGRLAQGVDQVQRFREWSKAWLMFMDHPWFGHGINNYSYPSYIKEMSVEYVGDHSMTSNAHNIFLQLLVEIGLIATLLLLVGFLWCVTNIVSKLTVISFTAFCIMFVTLAHSLVEFPLWNAHFLIAFIVIVGFAADRAALFKVKANALRWFTASLAVLMLLQSVKLWQDYSMLVSKSYALFNSPPEKLPQINDELYQTTQNGLLLNHLSERVMAMGLPLMFNQTLPDYTEDVLDRSGRRFPLPGVKLYQAIFTHWQGNTEAAKVQLDYVVKSYPRFAPQFVEMLANTENAKPLYEHMRLVCISHMNQQKMSVSACTPDQHK